ncbi:tyrosine-type recombinase/integrase [Nocardioides sp. GCM10027113]|uniref:tyrosine-type recombinase/integrase n=1 Tax=unclassified Nocardioides TaxID=2615069 RepID=UPI003613C14B
MKSNVLVSEAIDGWFLARAPRKDSPHTRAAYQRDLAAILRAASERLGRPVDDLCLGDLTLPVLRHAFGTWSQGRAAASVRRCHSTWSGFFEHLVSEELISGSPMPGVAKPRSPQRLPKPFAEDDAARIVRTLTDASVRRRQPWPELDAAVVLTGLVTGVRSAELLATDVGDVTRTPGNERIRVLGKGDAERSIPVEPLLLGILGTYLDSRRDRFPGTARQRGVEDENDPWAWWRPNDPLFVDRTGQRMRTGALQYLVELVYRDAGVNAARARGALVHALRHTAATRLVERGATAVELMDFLGHRSLATSQGYLASTAAGVRAAAARSPVYDLLAEAPDDEAASQ